MVNMWENLIKKDIDMVKVNFNGTMVRYMKVTGKMEENMDMEPGKVHQENTMKVSG